eukprot:NODE_2383_length_480_cov_710.909513_g1959_i0.p4 GENE.NODE_2383_length_480_cov_710.909513_g1959_i0~~NODE_2383_length_480_cov_710.909513_g1959_i0.p4  ORF type:complete len:53 (-),score=18.98 NODE_2383_length_480_cov_710.909513_g1959_i0:320-454(-)
MGSHSDPHTYEGDDIGIAGWSCLRTAGTLQPKVLVRALRFVLRT